MYAEKRLWDIPAALKEYHNIVYDQERNKYFMFGHKSADGISSPNFIGLPASLIEKIYTTNDEKIVHIKTDFGELTLFPLSTHFWIRSD